MASGNFSGLCEPELVLKSASHWDVDRQQRFNVGEGTDQYFSELLKSHKVLNITPRQLQCMCLWLAGNTSKRIAKILSISHRTIETHMSHVKIKNDFISREEIINRLHKIDLYCDIIFYAEYLRKSSETQLPRKKTLSELNA